MTIINCLLQIDLMTLDYYESKNICMSHCFSVAAVLVMLLLVTNIFFDSACTS